MNRVLYQLSYAAISSADKQRLNSMKIIPKPEWFVKYFFQSLKKEFGKS